MLVFLLVMVILKSFKEKYYPKELLNHPVYLSMIFYLCWMLISSITSELPVVSIKYFLVRFWFLGIFFHLAYILFRQDTRNINRFLWSYIIGIFAVALYSIFKQAQVNLFDHRVAHGSAAPFFIDHTSYGAAIALIFPISVALALNSKKGIVRIICWGLAGFFLFALLLSYSRAAWLSLILGGGVWLLIILKIRLRSIIIAGVAAIALFFTFQDNILWLLQRNTTDSSGDLVEHIQSIINIKSDASNLERINRWDAAIEMFKERPFLGWGPGTYQFQYAPFQASYNKTLISTNFGTGGNAHSEYLGILSEAGIPALLGLILIFAFILARGFALIKNCNISASHRNIAIACIVGLVTYIAHGFLNNFLDVDKIAAPFWGFAAILVALELHYAQKGKLSEGKNSVTKS
jgi:O-antigen ligase